LKHAFESLHFAPPGSLIERPPRHTHKSRRKLDLWVQMNSTGPPVEC